MTVAAQWIDRMRAVSVAAVAGEVGLSTDFPETPSALTAGPCPACGARTRHPKRRDRRGALGIPKDSSGGWHCFECEQSGDAIDLVSFHVGGRRFRDLGDEDKTAVRARCERFLGTVGSAPRVTRSAAAQLAPTYPDRAEVAAVWGRAHSLLLADDCVGHWCEGERGLSVVDLARLDLARQLDECAGLPAWAGGGDPWRPWPAMGLDLVVPLFDAKGEPRSLLFRKTSQGGRFKSAGAKGYQRAGLVNGVGRHLLKYGLIAPDPQLQVVVVEGEMDFLSACLRWAPGDCERAVFGIVAGSWSDQVAARVPDGATVIVATDPDEEGSKYARRIASTLSARCTVLHQELDRAA